MDKTSEICGDMVGNAPRHHDMDHGAALDSTFAYYKSLGIHTVKTGYAGGFA